MSALLIDMGGTHIRIAYYNRELSHLNKYFNKDFKDIYEAIDTYYQTTKLPPVDTVVMGVPTAVCEDKLTFLNSSWSFSQKEFAQRLKLKHLKIVNDFEPQALAMLRLQTKDITQIGGGQPKADYPKVVLGSGTGLGVAYLFPTGQKDWACMATEGGHVSIPVMGDLEYAVYMLLRQKFSHVSAERVISGQGLYAIYGALCTLKEQALSLSNADEIIAAAASRTGIAYQAVQMMCAWFGAVAGNTALTLNALGGVYLTGGMVRRSGMLAMLQESDFRQRFEEKGRRSDYMRQIPTYVVSSHNPVFLGLEQLL